jgi:hypothetical protein
VEVIIIFVGDTVVLEMIVVAVERAVTLLLFCTSFRIRPLKVYGLSPDSNF